MTCKLTYAEIAGAPTYVLSPSSARGNALVLHGYGSNKEEILGCGIAAANAGFIAYIPDLPGHGEHSEKLTWSAVRRFIHQLSAINFQAAVGHSLGGRLALLLPCPKIVLLSPPWSAVFEGSRTELLRTLRARRVREEGYYEGLTSILNQLPKLVSQPESRILLLYSKHDLATVKLTVKKGAEIGWTIQVITGVTHNDIISAPKVLKHIENWLTG